MPKNEPAWSCLAFKSFSLKGINGDLRLGTPSASTHNRKLIIYVFITKKGIDAAGNWFYLCQMALCALSLDTNIIEELFIEFGAANLRIYHFSTASEVWGLKTSKGLWYISLFAIHFTKVRTFIHPHSKNTYDQGCFFHTPCGKLIQSVEVKDI